MTELTAWKKARAGKGDEDVSDAGVGGGPDGGTSVASARFAEWNVLMRPPLTLLERVLCEWPVRGSANG